MLTARIAANVALQGPHVALTARSAVNATWRGDYWNATQLECLHSNLFAGPDRELGAA